MPARGATTSSKEPAGFRTKPPPIGGYVGSGPEQYYYALEIAPPTNATNPQTGPRMFPIVDDVTVFYMPDNTPRVLHESLLIYD